MDQNQYGSSQGVNTNQHGNLIDREEANRMYAQGLIGNEGGYESMGGTPSRQGQVYKTFMRGPGSEQFYGLKGKPPEQVIAQFGEPISPESLGIFGGQNAGNAQMFPQTPRGTYVQSPKAAGSQALDGATSVYGSYGSGYNNTASQGQGQQYNMISNNDLNGVGTYSTQPYQQTNYQGGFQMNNNQYGQGNNFQQPNGQQFVQTNGFQQGNFQQANQAYIGNETQISDTNRQAGLGLPTAYGIPIVATKKDTRHRIQAFQLQNGQVLDYAQMMQAHEQGQTDKLVLAPNREGELTFRTTPDGIESNNLDSLPSFQ